MQGVARVQEVSARSGYLRPRRPKPTNGTPIRGGSPTLHETATGGSGTVINLGDIEDLDPNAEVRNDQWYGDGYTMGLGSQMLRDGHVRQSVDAITGPLLAATWGFKPASKDQVDVEVADFCTWAFLEKNLWERFIRVGTTGYVRDGAALFEFTEKRCEVNKKRFPLHPGNGSGSTYSGFHQRPLSTVDEWVQAEDDSARLAGVVQHLRGSDTEPLSYPYLAVQRDLLFRLSWDQEGANFAGFAPLRSAYGAWKMKRLLQLLDMIRHEREGTGIPTITYPTEATPEDKKMVDRVLRDVRAHDRAYIKLPDGYTFKFSTTTGQSTGIAEAIERCNRDIAYNLGVAWMLLGVAGKTGSWALSDTQRGQYILLLERHARFWETALNIGHDCWSPIERLVRMNYGPDVGVPRIEARNMPTKDWAEILKMVPTLLSSGALRLDDPLRDQVRNIMDFGPEDVETLVEHVPASAPAKQEPEPEEEEEEAPA